MTIPLRRRPSREALPVRWRALLILPALLVLASCGADDGLGQRYPVSGRVTYNGNPLEKGEISFIPEDAKSNIGASGRIDKGTYTLSTGGDGDGSQAGKYKMTISAKEDYMARAKELFEKDTKQKRESTYVPPQYVSKAEDQARSLIPAGYGDTRTTTLTAEVKPQSNSIDFKLSDAEAPPEPPKDAARGRRGGGRRPGR